MLGLFKADVIELEYQLGPEPSQYGDLQLGASPKERSLENTKKLRVNPRSYGLLVTFGCILLPEGPYHQANRRRRSPLS
jgi:hypothetical protein